LCAHQLNQRVERHFEANNLGKSCFSQRISQQNATLTAPAATHVSRMRRYQDRQAFANDEPERGLFLNLLHAAKPFHLATVFWGGRLFPSPRHFLEQLARPALGPFPGFSPWPKLREKMQRASPN
jgi:hypothetical protein